MPLNTLKLNKEEVSVAVESIEVSRTMKQMQSIKLGIA